MAERVFSENYEYGAQQKFLRLLREKKLQEAAEVLRNFPRPLKDSEKGKYCITLREGYEALTQVLIREGVTEAVREEIADLRQRLGEYHHALGEAKDISAKLCRLQEYEELSKSPGELKNDLKNLDDYRDIGDNPKQLREKMQDLGRKARELEAISADLANV